MSITKQSVGIGISKSTFTACLRQRDETGSLTFSKSTDFAQDHQGLFTTVSFLLQFAAMSFVDSIYERLCG
jgi:hypothetical protein